MPYFSAHGLTMAFGGVRALDGVTFAIERGEHVDERTFIKHALYQKGT
jgi:ABC-type branched-subunit amino acid transport system ATPase component